MILVQPALAWIDPRTLAALLAHEACHAEADLSGMLKADEEALGVVAACYLDEQRASLAELSVWLTVYGRGGRADPVHP